MLILNVEIIPEGWDEIKEEFIPPVYAKLRLEHSLFAVSKWEAIFEKPFLETDSLTAEEIFEYVKCMAVDDVDPSIYDCLTESNFKEINNYIHRPMSATKWPKEKSSGGNRDTLTNELIYYWMLTLGIPWECQHWHLEHLIALIKMCNFKNSPPKKMTMAERMAYNTKLNAERRARLHSKG